MKLRFASISLVLGLLAGCGGGGGGGGPTQPQPQPDPQILSISPTPVRAGEDVIIRGTNLQGNAALAPAQSSVQVIIGNRTLTPSSAGPAEVIARVPLDLMPGNHSVRITANGRSSNTISHPFSVFTVTGTYSAEGPRVFDSCNVDDDPIGTVNEFEVSLTDNRPSLGMRIGGFRFTGTIGDGGDFSGQFQQTDPSLGVTTTVTLGGNILTLSNGAQGFSGMVSIAFTGGPLPPCSVRWNVLGTRLTTTPTARVLIMDSDVNPTLSGIYRLLAR